MQTRANMGSTEIPREKWVGFFDEFSKQRKGWVVTVEVLGADLGDQEEANGLPLVGISADVRDRENRITIMVGDRPDAHLTRIINNPKRVWVKMPEEAAHEALEVEDEDGTRTLVSFRHILAEETDRQLQA